MLLGIQQFLVSVGSDQYTQELSTLGILHSYCKRLKEGFHSDDRSVWTPTLLAVASW